MDGSIWVLLHDFPLPDGYNVPTVSLAVRLGGRLPARRPGHDVRLSAAGAPGR